MMLRLLKLLFVLINLDNVLTEDDRIDDEIDVLMPSVRPEHNDDYYCTVTKLPQEKVYIKKFIPHAEKSYAHHMLLYTCERPGQMEGYWKCGEMSYTDDGLNHAPKCRSKANIIYAWAMNARELTLPDDVSFEVGGDTKARYLVVNVHYKDVSIFQGDAAINDTSGISLKISREKTSKLAGIYLLGSWGILPGHSTTIQQTACHFRENAFLHPFAFRTHTHSHGTLVRGYRIRDGKWKLIGEKNPQEEQMFYDIKNPEDVIIQKSDYLAAECFFRNNGSETVRTGATANDEMCNFYIMYYVESDYLLRRSECFHHLDWTTYFSSNGIKVPDGVQLMDD